MHQLKRRRRKDHRRPNHLPQGGATPRRVRATSASRRTRIPFFLLPLLPPPAASASHVIAPAPPTFPVSGGSRRRIRPLPAPAAAKRAARFAEAALSPPAHQLSHRRPCSGGSHSLCSAAHQPPPPPGPATAPDPPLYHRRWRGWGRRRAPTTPTANLRQPATARRHPEAAGASAPLPRRPPTSAPAAPALPAVAARCYPLIARARLLVFSPSRRAGGEPRCPADGTVAPWFLNACGGGDSPAPRTCVGGSPTAKRRRRRGRPP